MNNNGLIKKSTYLEKWDIEKIMEVAIEEKNEMIIENLEGIEEEYVMNIFGDNINEAIDFINNNVFSNIYERNETRAEYIRNNYNKAIKDFKKCFEAIVSVDETLESDVRLERVKESGDYCFVIYNEDVETVDTDVDCDYDYFITVNITDEDGCYTEDIFTNDEYDELEDKQFNIIEKGLLIPQRAIEDIILGEANMKEYIKDCIDEIITYDYENYS